MECDTAEWMSFGNNGTFASILAIEKDANARHLLGLHHDAFMFHQANMRWEGVERHAPIGGVSGQYSLLQLWVETVVTEVTKHVNWPIISLKHDDVSLPLLFFPCLTLEYFLFCMLTSTFPQKASSIFQSTRKARCLQVYNNVPACGNQHCRLHRLGTFGE